MAQDLSRKHKHLILISGRYEGIDERVKKILKAEEISIGPFVMTDGDIGALAVTSAVVRLIPGVLGKAESLEERRVTSGETYTRPELITVKGKKFRVPAVLLSGHQKNIHSYRSKK